MKKVIYGLMAFSPMLALAQATTPPNLSNIGSLMDSIKGLLDKLVPLLFGIAIIYFFWGVIKYIRAAGDPKAAAEGKSIMIYGVIGLAVMVSIYGLINFLTGSLGLNNQPIDLPNLPTN